MMTFATAARRPLSLAVLLGLLLLGRSAATWAVDAPICSSIDCSLEHRSKTNRLNILLIVTDDHAYCHWAFMGGWCSNNHNRECYSNSDCAVAPDAGTCVGNTGSGALRLNTLECRNRRPNINESPKGHFPFDRSGVKTYTSGTAGEAHTIRTPYFDELASQGAIFPRAHVGGTGCTLSRNVMQLGKYRSHDGAVPNTTFLWPAIARRLKEGYTDAQDDPGYKAGGFVKLGGVSETAGGFNDGDGSYGIGKFKCKVGSTPDPVCDSTISTCYGQGNRDAVPDPQCSAVVQTQLLADSRQARTSGLRKIVDFLEQSTKGDILNVFNRATSPIQAQRKYPFYIWFGPNIPHQPSVPETDFLTYYGQQREDHERKHFGRISWLDEDVGGLLYYLKNTCICEKDGTKRPLYDSTVIIVLADQGFLMPDAKGNASENTFRTPIIINEPGHRPTTGSPSVPPGRLVEQFAHSVDLMPTILAYAGILKSCTTTADCDSTKQEICVAEHPGRTVGTDSVGVCRRSCDDATTCTFPDGSAPDAACKNGGCTLTDVCYYTGTGAPLSGSAHCPTSGQCVCGYPFSRNLKPFVQAPSLTTSVRELQFLEGNDQAASVTTRPGLLGVCAKAAPGCDDPDNPGIDCVQCPTGGQAQQFCLAPLHPCRQNSDCNFKRQKTTSQQIVVDLGDCILATDTAHKGKVCINKPWVACGNDADCLPTNPATALCSGNQCVKREIEGSFADFDGRSCSVDADCTPGSLCKPLVLKLVKSLPIEGQWWIKRIHPATIAAYGAAYDMNGDPDEQHNLFDLDRDYLGGPEDLAPGSTGRLGSDVQSCLHHFRALAPSKLWGGVGTGCPFM